ncbi:cardiolipin synthase [Winogradskyella sp. J14-2]|uniref:cardiolipin synthase n=1 Tax=Winogradskyella sp. J14-2 TaxID=1936080 RepID=UPI001E4C98A4|nr:cardiolipin synthase [Winogradskyella sp. J14-2]
MPLYIFIIYILILLIVCIRIIINTTTPSKGLAYLLLVISFPVVGIIFYLSVGLNYRKKKLYQKKILIDEKAFPEINERKQLHSQKVLAKHKDTLGNFYPMLNLLKDKSFSSDNNTVQLYINGENKFPAIIDSLKAAKHHIHIEYYIYENDTIGNEIAELLIAKAQEGVKVRFIYDDLGSKNIRSNFVKKLQKAGVEAFPFYKINFIHFANRLNYRNHRKIIVIDGTTGFVGGINVSDKYINTSKNKLFWRDTHLKIVGTSVLNLQFTFLTDWNFCSKQNIAFSQDYFPIVKEEKKYGNDLVQIVASGPDSDHPNIMYSLVQTILLAKKELLITTPYFIPNSSFINAIKIAALSGVKVTLLVPGISDSFIVNVTSQSFYQELLEVGVKIYKYNKGFVHAKTLVCDQEIAVVGTANLDIRSFDLNFEINAITYDTIIAQQLSNQFYEDLQESIQLEIVKWNNRPVYVKFMEKVFRLFSSLM